MLSGISSAAALVAQPSSPAKTGDGPIPQVTSTPSPPTAAAAVPKAAHGTGPHQALSQGATARSLATDFPRMPYLLMVKKDVNGLEDLYGRTLSISAPNGVFFVKYSALVERFELNQQQYYVKSQTQDRVLPDAQLRTA